MKPRFLIILRTRARLLSKNQKRCEQVALVMMCMTASGGDLKLTGVAIMGKYVLGWILGVPVIVLVIIYMLFN
jgi:hypothetical protein